jgi:putative acetyltransferase
VGVLLRRQTAADVPTVDGVHRSAFDRDVEAALVHALRADAGWVPALSLVAEDAAGRVVGHVVGTLGSVGDTPVVGLGPLGVLPAAQGRGVGSALVHAVLAAADAFDLPLAVLLGDPGYYARFGFVAASSIGVVAPDAAWGEHFQARPLGTYVGERGLFAYAAPFVDL